MKKSLLLLTTIVISVVTTAQRVYNSSDKYILKNNRNSDKVIDGTLPFDYTPNSSVKKPVPTPTSSMAVNIIDMGKAGNAFGVAFGGKNFLWADPTINAISFSHRSDPFVIGQPNGTTGWIMYDYSIDGGTTWNVNYGPAYQSNNTSAPPFANARFPQSVIYNPPGNLVTDSAYLAYFAPSLTSTNGTTSIGGWGGHVYGAMQLSGLILPTKTEKVTNRYNVPDDFTLTKTGVVYNIDMATDLSGSNPVGFKDSIFINKGVWDPIKRDFTYTETKIHTPMSKDNKGKSDYAGDMRIAFADNGTTGYLALLGHNSYALEPDSIYHLIVYKTTDGGTTWGDPINVSMDGAKPLLPGAGVATKFTTGFELDATVDKNDNLHVTVPISPEVDQGFAITSKAGVWGIFDVYTTDGGSNWKAKLIGNPSTLAGNFGISSTDVTNPKIVEYNRCQVSKNYSGDKLFFTYFDTNDTINYGTQNIYPNAFITGYDVTSGKWTNPISTINTFAQDFVTFGCASYYVFENAGTYTIPIAFQELLGGPAKTGEPCLFHYLDSLIVTDADFTENGNEVPLTLLLSTSEIRKIDGVTVSQNHPNPFSNSTSFNMTLEKQENVSVDVFNTVGQKVLGINPKIYSAGLSTITIDASNLSPGVYFYSIKTTNAAITQRMIVK